MSDIALRTAFPDLVDLPGVRRVSNITETTGEPAMLVEFADGMQATITHWKGDETQFAITYKDESGAARYMTPTSAREVMALLTDFAFIAANPNMPLHELIYALVGLRR